MDHEPQRLAPPHVQRQLRFLPLIVPRLDLGGPDLGLVQPDDRLHAVAAAQIQFADPAADRNLAVLGNHEPTHARRAGAWMLPVTADARPIGAGPVG